MVSSRTATAMLGLALSLVVSVAAWYYWDTLMLFLLVPFIPFLFRRGEGEKPPLSECPACGFRTQDQSFEYCPRDGSRLE